MSAVIWNASRLIAHNGGPISRGLYRAANVYCRAYNNLNYDMQTNGEFYLLGRLSILGIKTVFDVGANKGEFTLACLSRFPEAHIHSFEIVPATFEKLSANVHSSRVSLNSYGLANFEGRTEINYNPDLDRSSSLVAGDSIHNGDWQRVKVNVETGDQYCARRQVRSIDLLKIDVEGAEHLVLEGFSRSLEGGNIAAVQFEFGMANIYSKFLLKDYWEFFTLRGFTLGPLMPKGVNFRDYSVRDENFHGCSNYLAVHETKPDMIAAVKQS
jgi:FkbM family methyltransferase